jgi:hypothetical protein
MWASTVVIVTPDGDFLACVEQIAKPVRIQAFVTEASIEAFDMAILHGLAGFNMVHRDLPLDAPGQEVP